VNTINSKHILAFLLIASFSSCNNAQSYNHPFDKSFNPERVVSGVPPIEDDWIKHRSTKDTILWSNRSNSIETFDPCHVLKISYQDNGNLIAEEDDFHFQSSGPTAYRLVVVYHFKGDTLSSRLITYFKDQYPPTSGRPASPAEVDSVLAAWKLPSYYQKHLIK
jgi:hypothetical protein